MLHHSAANHECMSYLMAEFWGDKDILWVVGFISKTPQYLKPPCESLTYLKAISSDNSRTKKPFLIPTCIKYLFLFKPGR
jgi:hypothetical protein